MTGPGSGPSSCLWSPSVSPPRRRCPHDERGDQGWTASDEFCTPCRSSLTERHDRGGELMAKVIAGITTSLDGYITGPNDGPGKGLGDGGERLHYWVFGGPWSYDEEPTGEPTGVDKEYLDRAIARL